MPEIETIEKLMTLFRGSKRAHGVYTEVIDNDPLKKKVKGKAITISAAPTLRKWTQHVNGELGMGVIPINEENKCWWGVLDIDGEVDHIKILTRIKELNMPLVMCYSKSRSAHCFLFLEESVPAVSMRSILEEMASKLGVADCEKFPKQDTLNADKGDLGNWLNMPYFGNTRKGVVLVDGQLQEQELEDFLKYAFSKRLTPDGWNALIGKIQKNIDDLEAVLDGAPPCLQYILKTQGICEGTRNRLMYNIAVYCKKKYSDNDYPDKVKEIHDKYSDNPLSIRELNTIIDSVKGKDYRYQCKDSMLKQFCNSSICVERDHGIDLSKDIKCLKNATRILTTPVIYAVEVELEADRPGKVFVTTEQLLKQDLFRKECSEQIHKTFIPVPTKTWNTLSTDIINTAINQDPPFDMMEENQIYIALMDYLVNRAQHTAKALTAKDGVYHDADEGKIYFKLEGFRGYLISRGIFNRDLTTWKLGSKLNKLYIPTEDVDFSKEKRVKRKLEIGDKRITVLKDTHYVRWVSDKEINLSEELREEFEGVL